MPLTLFDKLWAAHEIARRDDGEALLWVDRHYVHEGSFHAFSKLEERGAAVAEPGLTFGVADHYVPTRGSRRDIANPEIARMVRQVEDNTAKHHVKLFGLDDPRRRRDGTRHRICRRGDPRAVDRRPAHALQHVDRSRRTLRHGRAGRGD